MANKLPVKWFSSEMAGAPQVTGTTTIIDVLKKTLIEGFNLKAIDTLTYDSETKLATITVNGGHGQLVDVVIQVAGATDDAFNGEHRAIEVTNTTIKYKPATAPGSSSASGSPLTVRTAPVGGWKVTHEDGEGATARAIFRSESAASGYGGLRVTASSAELVYSEVSIDSYITRSGEQRMESYQSGSWQLVADEMLFYLSKEYSAFVFGDINSVLDGDRDCTVLCGSTGGGSTTPSASTYPSDAIGAATSASFKGCTPWISFINTAYIGRPYSLADFIATIIVDFPVTNRSSLLETPNPTDGKFYLSLDPLAVHERVKYPVYNYSMRGHLPGIYPTKHKGDSVHWATVRNVEGQADKAFKLISLRRLPADDAERNPIICAAIDIFGPWR